MGYKNANLYPIKILSLIIHCRWDNSYIMYQDFCWNAKTRHCLVPLKITLFRWYRGLPSATHKFSTEKYRDLWLRCFEMVFTKPWCSAGRYYSFCIYCNKSFTFPVKYYFPLNSIIRITTILYVHYRIGQTNQTFDGQSLGEHNTDKGLITL